MRCKPSPMQHTGLIGDATRLQPTLKCAFGHCRLRVRPGAPSVLVQLCDLAGDPAVESLLQSPFPKGAACRARSGFLTQKQQADIVTVLSDDSVARTMQVPPEKG